MKLISNRYPFQVLRSRGKVVGYVEQRRAFGEMISEDYDTYTICLMTGEVVTEGKEFWGPMYGA